VTATCPRCGWTGPPAALASIYVGDGFPPIRCCPNCACEKVRVDAPVAVGDSWWARLLRGPV